MSTSDGVTSARFARRAERATGEGRPGRAGHRGRRRSAARPGHLPKDRGRLRRTRARSSCPRPRRRRPLDHGDASRPRRRSPAQTARPMPPAPPVTTATRPGTGPASYVLVDGRRQTQHTVRRPCGSRSSVAAPAGCTSRRSPKQLDPSRDITVWERNAARRHVRLRCRVLRRDARRHRARRPGDPRRDGVRVRPLGRHRRLLPRVAHHLRRARLRRAGAGPRLLELLQQPLPRTRRARCISAREAPDVDALSRVARPGDRDRRPQFDRPGQARRRVRPDLRRAAARSTSGWAPARCSTRSPSTCATRRGV